MHVRLAMPDEEDDLVEMGRRDVEETMPSMEWFDEVTWRQTFRRYLDRAHPTFFVAERTDGKLAGFLEAYIWGYEYRTGLYVGQRVLYVTPENRGTRAAASLVKHLLSWARDLGAVEVIGGNSNSFNSERTARFLEHLGFRRVGYTLSASLEASDVFR